MASNFVLASRFHKAVLKQLQFLFGGFSIDQSSPESMCRLRLKICFVEEVELISVIHRAEAIFDKNHSLPRLHKLLLWSLTIRSDVPAGRKAEKCQKWMPDIAGSPWLGCRGRQRGWSSHCCATAPWRLPPCGLPSWTETPPPPERPTAELCSPCSRSLLHSAPLLCQSPSIIQTFTQGHEYELAVPPCLVGDAAEICAFFVEQRMHQRLVPVTRKNISGMAA